MSRGKSHTKPNVTKIEEPVNSFSKPKDTSNQANGLQPKLFINSIKTFFEKNKKVIFLGGGAIVLGVIGYYTFVANSKPINSASSLQKWYASASAPTTGNTNDLWLNTATGDVYQYTASSSSWNKVNGGNLKGKDGVAGTQWTVSTTSPDTSTAKLNDLWLNATTGNVYKFDGSSNWVNLNYNLTGKSTQWIVASSAPTSSTSGNTNDLYLNGATGDVYQFNGTSWVSTGTNLKGASGSGGGGIATYKLPGGTGVLQGNVEFFGDSITFGYNLPNPSTQRYSALLAAQYGFTAQNYANSGDTILDQYVKIINNHVSDPVTGRTVVLKIGYNDTDENIYSDTNYFLFKEAMMSSLLYLCLSSSQVFNNRGTVAGISRPTGTWVSSSYTNIGSYTASANGTVQATQLTGRYIGFSTSNGNTNNCTATYAVDGAAAVAFSMPAAGIINTTPNNVSAYPITWIFDTRSSTTHTLTIVNGSSSTLDIDFFFAFDNLSGNSNSNVIVSLNDPSSFIQTTTPQAGYSAGNLSRQKLVMEVQQYCVAYIRQTYGAKIIAVQEYLGWGWGNKVFDGVHPDPNGQKYIADRITSVLTNGESVTFM